MDSRFKLVAITCASMVVATILGIVTLLHYSQVRDQKPAAETNQQQENDEVQAMAYNKTIYETYGLDPSKDPYAYLQEKDFFDKPASNGGAIITTKKEQVSMFVTSVQKDIRVHIVNSEGTLLTGQKLVVQILDEDGNLLGTETETSKKDDADTEDTKDDEQKDKQKQDTKKASEKQSGFVDEDEDGVIYVSNVPAGEYEIKLNPLADYMVPKTATSITVSNDISYTAIHDISFLIKTEDEIDATVEDSALKEAEQDADGTETNVRLADGASIFGIDVSKWNKTIDWEKAKQAGVEFAIIRCGYRGSSTGALVEDPYFRKNIEGALDAGVRVGVYFFTQATTPVEAVEEASMVLSLCKDYKVSFPMYIDTEGAGANARAEGLSVEDRTAAIKAFCETITNEGYKAGVYASKHWFEKKLHTEQLSSYEIWLAQYSKKATYEGEYGMWQYTSAGTVDGITTLVDFDISYIDYE